MGAIQQVLVGISSGVIDPIPAISGLLVYVNNQSIDPAVTTDGNAISTWDAVSPTTEDATVVGTGVTLNITGGGVREVEFANNGGLTLSSNTVADYTPGTDNFWFAFKPGSGGVTGGMVISRGETTVANRQYEIEAHGAGPTLYDYLRIYIGGQLICDETSDGIRMLADDIIIIQVTPSLVSVWKNDSAAITPVTLTGTGTTTAVPHIGTRISTSQKLDAPSTLQMVAIGSGTLSGTERTAIYDYHSIN